MRDGRETLCLRLGERRVGRDQRDRGVLAHAAFQADRERVRRQRRGQAAPAELAILLERRGPEMRAVADRHAADRVDHDDRADGRAVARLRGGRAEPALQVDGRCAESRARVAEREVAAGIRRRRKAEIAIGRKAAPVLVAAVEQVEHDRARHDRHDARGRSRSRGPARAATPARRSARRARRPSRPRARSRRCAPRSRPAASRSMSRVPGAPPRTSPDATAGSSNTMAVTPEASLASSALPTSRPGTSVIRLRMAHVRSHHRRVAGDAACRNRSRLHIRAAWPPTSPFSPHCLPDC